MSSDHRRLLRIATWTAGYRARWIHGLSILGFLLLLLILDVFVRPYASNTTIENAIRRLDASIKNLESIELPVAPKARSLDELMKRIQDLNASLDLADRDKVEIQLTEAKRTLLESLERIWQRDTLSANEWSQARKNLSHSLETLYQEVLETKRDLIRERDAESSWKYRLRADIVSVFQWMTPVGAIAAVVILYLMFFVPTSELLKPFSWISLRLRGLSIAGLRLELSEERVRSDKTELQYAIETIGNIMRSHYVLGAREVKLGTYFGFFVLDILPQLGSSYSELKQGSFRATLHVPYYLGREEYIQALDYFDANGEPITNIAGVGRIFSIRYAILGRAVREEKPRYDPKVTTNAEELVQGWGMTQDEAKKASLGKRQTYLAMRLLDDKKEILAIVYMDAIKDHMFDGPTRTDCEGIDHTKNVKRAEEIERIFNEYADTCYLKEKLTALRKHISWQQEGRIEFGPKT